MGVWTELVGVRKDLHLRSRWWHHVARGGAVLGAIVVYFMTAGVVARRAVKPTMANTYSLTLLTHSAGRPDATTTLADLNALPGTVGRITGDGNLTPLDQRGGPNGVRCSARAVYKMREAVAVDHVTYQSIPDYPGQPDAEARHCVATLAYASLTAKSIVVYVPDGTGSRKQNIKGTLAGVTVMFFFLLAYWNVYYRGLMPLYGKRRQQRRLRRQRRFEMR